MKTQASVVGFWGVSKTFLKSAIVSACVSVCCAGLLAMPTRAHAQNPFAPLTRLTLRILFLPVSTVGSTVGTFLTTSAAGTEKKALAVVALEDAANYYQSGEVGGVLPSVLKRLRGTDAELAKLEDPALIEAVVESAEKFLELYEKAVAEEAAKAAEAAKTRKSNS